MTDSVFDVLKADGRALWEQFTRATGLDPTSYASPEIACACNRKHLVADVHAVFAAASKGET